MSLGSHRDTLVAKLTSSLRIFFGLKSIYEREILSLAIKGKPLVSTHFRNMKARSRAYVFGECERETMNILNNKWVPNRF